MLIIENHSGSLFRSKILHYHSHSSSSSLELHLYCYTKDAAYSWDDIAEGYPWAKHDIWTTQDQDYSEVACCVKRFSLETVIATPGDIHDWTSSQLAHLPSKIWNLSDSSLGGNRRREEGEPG